MTSTSFLLAAALLACPEPPDGASDTADTEAAYERGYAAGKAEADSATEAGLAALQAELETLRADLAAVVGRVDAIEAAPYATEAYCDEAAAGVTTWVESEGYLDATALDGLATEAYCDAVGAGVTAWVESEAYIDSTALVGLATEAYCDDLVSPVDVRVAAIEADYATATSLAAAETYHSDLTTDLDTRLAAVEADYVDSTTFSARFIDTDTTLEVPADYATLDDALAALDGVRIGASATVEILLASGTYTHTSPVAFTHPDGDRIHVLGDGLGAELAFVGTHGLVVGDGRTLGLVDNIVVSGDNTTDTFGVYAYMNAVVNLGTGVTVSNFYHGIVAEQGAAIRAESVVADANTYDGFRALDGGYLYAYGAEATDNGVGGFSAQYGAGINAAYATADTSTAYQGFQASQAGWVNAEGAESSGQTSRAAFWAADLGMMVADNATATGTNGYGYSFAGVDGAFLSIQGATASSGSPCYAHSESIIHSNSATSCLSEVPASVYEVYGTSSPSGAIRSW